MQDNEGAGFLLDYCARRLDPAESAMVERHVRLCASCRQLVDAQRALWDNLDCWEAAEISAGFDRRLYAALEAERERNILRRWFDTAAARWSFSSWRPVISVAAASIILIAALWVETPGTAGSGEQMPTVQAERVDVDAAERAFEDLEMLRELSPRITPPANSPGSI